MRGNAASAGGGGALCLAAAPLRRHACVAGQRLSLADPSGVLVAAVATAPSSFASSDPSPLFPEEGISCAWLISAPIGCQVRLSLAAPTLSAAATGAAAGAVAAAVPGAAGADPWAGSLQVTDYPSARLSATCFSLQYPLRRSPAHGPRRRMRRCGLTKRLLFTMRTHSLFARLLCPLSAQGRTLYGPRSNGSADSQAQTILSSPNSSLLILLDRDSCARTRLSSLCFCSARVVALLLDLKLTDKIRFPSCRSYRCLFSPLSRWPWLRLPSRPLSGL